MSDLDNENLYPIVEEVVKKYEIRNLVETGTGPRSSGLIVADRLGLSGYSCDVFVPAVIDAWQRHPTAMVIDCESLQFLRTVLPGLEEPTFFWLDGHCPTDPSDKPGPVFPLYEEMLLIKEYKMNYQRDVLWLDDIAMITAEDNPHRQNWNVYLGGPGILWDGCKKHSWQAYLDVFADTHTFVVEGSLARLEPK